MTINSLDKLNQLNQKIDELVKEEYSKYANIDNYNFISENSKYYLLEALDKERIGVNIQIKTILFGAIVLKSEGLSDDSTGFVVEKSFECIKDLLPNDSTYRLIRLMNDSPNKDFNDYVNYLKYANIFDVERVINLCDNLNENHMAKIFIASHIGSVMTSNEIFLNFVESSENNGFLGELSYFEYNKFFVYLAMKNQGLNALQKVLFSLSENEYLDDLSESFVKDNINNFSNFKNFTDLLDLCLKQKPEINKYICNIISRKNRNSNLIFSSSDDRMTDNNNPKHNFN